METYRIGIDVGGTHTDAVLLDEHNQVVAETKSSTTKDVTTGIYAAMHKVITEAKVDTKKSAMPCSEQPIVQMRSWSEKG